MYVCSLTAVEFLMETNKPKFPPETDYILTFVVPDGKALAAAISPAYWVLNSVNSS